MTEPTRSERPTAEGERFLDDSRSLRQLVWQHLGELLYNQLVTYIPSQWLRRNTLRLFGAKFGRRSNILRGTTVLHTSRLTVGDECSIGFRCLLDARGWLTIGNNVIIASDTHFLPGYHDFRSPDFDSVTFPTFVEDWVWLATRVTVEGGVTIGRGGVALTCSLVRQDVAPLTVVAGVPAKQVGTRPETALGYHTAWRPWGI